MRYLSPLLIALAGMGSAHAMDVSTQSLVVTGYVTSKVTSAPFDRKLMVQARDDAAAERRERHEVGIGRDLHDRPFIGDRVLAE